MNPGKITAWWLIPLSIIPALLATILVFLDQQITSVIVNRREHKLKVMNSRASHIILAMCRYRREHSLLQKEYLTVEF